MKYVYILDDPKWDDTSAYSTAEKAVEALFESVQEEINDGADEDSCDPLTCEAREKLLGNLDFHKRATFDALGEIYTILALEVDEGESKDEA